MIIARSPLRISLGGGGTDLPSYYRNHGGFLIAAAIDRYVYITIHDTFIDDISCGQNVIGIIELPDEWAKALGSVCGKMIHILNIVYRKYRIKIILSQIGLVKNCAFRYVFNVSPG